LYKIDDTCKSVIYESTEEFDDCGVESTQMINLINGLDAQINNFCLIKGERINAYYVSNLRVNLMRIVKDFPIWSNVMNDIYGTKFSTATSAPVEGYTAQLKRLFSKPLSADRFIASHLKSIEGDMKITRSKQICKQIQNSKQNFSISKNVEPNHRCY